MRNPLAAAADRMRARADGGAHFAGASNSGLFYDFVMGTLSANSAIMGSLRILRNRARELVWSKNGTASAIPQIYSEQVIGETGITYQAAIAAPDGSKDDRTNDALEYHYQRAGEARHFTTDRSLSRLEVDTLLTEAEITDGEILIREVPGFDNAYGYAVEILDPDQLDVSLNREKSPGQNRIIMGIEVDEWGAPLIYHLLKNHPSDTFAGRHMPVPASQIIHRFVRRRPRQARGMTWYAPMLVDFGMHGGWRTASVIASRVAATSQGFYEVGEDAEGLEAPEGKSTVPRFASPGMFSQLPKGFKLQQWAPHFPQTEFAQFDTAMLRSLAVGFRVSSIRVSGNLSDTSWSSSRTGRQDEIAVFTRLQGRHVDTVTRRLHEGWLRNALLRGALPEVRSLPVETLTMAAWHPKVHEWPDPEADLNVALAERRAGLTSLQRIGRRLGRNLWDIFQEIAEENRWAQEAGVTIDVSPVSSARAPVFGAPAPGQPTTTPSGEEPRRRLRAVNGGEG